MTGLPPNHLKVLIDVIQQFPNVDKAAFFGSRAKGNAVPASDVDLALYGANIIPNDLWRIRDQLEERTLLPYFFDLLHYETLVDRDVKAHIDRVAMFFYDRNDFQPLSHIDSIHYPSQNPNVSGPKPVRT